LTHQSTRLPILLASDFPIFRDSVKAHFEKAPEIEVVACANQSSEVIPLLESYRPKLVLLDLNIEWDDLCALLDEIHKTTDVRSLIMSDDLESSKVIQVLRHGANGVVPRRTTQDLFTKSITSVLAGHFWVSRAMITDFVHLIRQNSDGQKMSENLVQSENIEISSLTAGSRASDTDVARYGLTKREVQIIGALVDGQTNKDIAGTFGISEYTVKHHLTNIYDKLGVYNRVELVLFAMNHGLCPAPGAVVVPDAI